MAKTIQMVAMNKILIVCDSELELARCNDVINCDSIEYQIRHVESMQQLPEQIESFIPDLIIAEFPSKAILSVEDLKYFTVVGPHLPLIIISDIENAENVVACMKSGATDYVPKHKFQQLGGVVAQAIGNKSKITESYVSGSSFLKNYDGVKYALEIANAGIWDWNIASNEVIYSRRWKELLGYKEGELSSSLDEWKSRVHPDDIENVLKVLELHLSEGKEYCVEYRLRTKKGSYKWILDNGKVIYRNSDGSPSRMAGAYTDIDQLKTAENKYSEFDKKYHQLIDSLPVGVFEMDLNGKIIEGTLKPSTDTNTHLELYKNFAQIGAILHSH